MRGSIGLAALLVVAVASGCGGAPPTGPTPASPAAPASPLASGPYTLTLTLSLTGVKDCQGSFCSSITLCTGMPEVTTASTPVTVDRSGDSAIVTVPASGATFEMDLDLGTGSAGGTASGAFKGSAGLFVTITGAGSGTPATIETSSPAGTQGSLQGMLTIDGAGCSNNAHHWTLAPATREGVS